MKWWCAAGWVTALGLLACLLEAESRVSIELAKFQAHAELIATAQIQQVLPEMLEQVVRARTAAIRDYMDAVVMSAWHDYQAALTPCQSELVGGVHKRVKQ